MAAIVLDNVRKIHKLRSARARRLKDVALSLFRRPVEEKTIAAADGLSLSVGEGRALGVIGSNGAGKTTLLRLIAGITPPTEGTVTTRGRVLPLLELGAGFHPELSGYENILLQGVLFGVSRRRLEGSIPDIVAFAELEEFIHMPVKHYSSGMYVRLGFAISVHMEPDVLLLDEVFSVGDVFFQRKCMERMAELHEAGKTFLLVTHDMDLVERTCDEVVWLEKGRIVMRGSPLEVAHRYRREMFEKSFPRPEPVVRTAMTMATGTARFGNGKVTFDYIELRDGEGALRHRFENGDALQARLRYVLHGEASELFCYVFIFSEHGHGSACLSNVELGRSIRPNADGRGEVVFRVDRLDLAPGNYQVTAAMLVDKPMDLDAIGDLHLRVCPLRVAAREGSNVVAGLEPPCEWEHSTAG